MQKLLQIKRITLCVGIFLFDSTFSKRWWFLFSLSLLSSFTKRLISETAVWTKTYQLAGRKAFFFSSCLSLDIKRLRYYEVNVTGQHVEKLNIWQLDSHWLRMRRLHGHFIEVNLTEVLEYGSEIYTFICRKGWILRALPPKNVKNNRNKFFFSSIKRFKNEEAMMMSP